MVRIASTSGKSAFGLRSNNPICTGIVDEGDVQIAKRASTGTYSVVQLSAGQLKDQKEPLLRGALGFALPGCEGQGFAGILR